PDQAGSRWSGPSLKAARRRRRLQTLTIRRTLVSVGATRGRGDMAAYNIVRFKVKPGREQEFLDAHRRARPNFRGFIDGAMVKTGDRTYCIVVKWASFKSIANARPGMIAMLDSFRDCLEDLGEGMGVTDPVSGEAVVTLKIGKPKAKKNKKKPTRKAKKK